jgi:hypothetical protein
VFALFAFITIILFVQDSMEMLVTAKIAFLIASIIQFIIAALLLCGGYSLYHKKVKVSKKKKFWRCVVCAMLILGILFLIGSIVTFIHFGKVVELTHETWSSALAK